MSSHHIVREDQEPALLILHAHAIPFAKIQELLEWMPTVLVASSEIETVLSWGIKVDVLITPPAEVNNWEIKLADQFPIKIIPLNSDQDLLTTAFNVIMNSKAKAINCLLPTKDHLSKLEVHPEVDIEAFAEGKRWSWIKSGKFEKWVAATSKLYLYPDDRVIEVVVDGIFSFVSEPSFWVGEELV